MSPFGGVGDEAVQSKDLWEGGSQRLGKTKRGEGTYYSGFILDGGERWGDGEMLRERATDAGRVSE